jgi:hypothetical protein
MTNYFAVADQMACSVTEKEEKESVKSKQERKRRRGHRKTGKENSNEIKG